MTTIDIFLLDNLKKCSASANTGASVPNVLPITIAVTADGLGFQFPDNFLSDMLSMLKCLDTKIGSVLPTQLFPKPNLPIHIKEIFIASPTNVKITIALKGPFKFLGGKIKIDDLELSVEWKKGEDLKFSGSTTVTVGSIAVGLALEKQGKSYQLAVSVDSFKLNQLEELIGPTTFTDFMSMLGSLDGFGIKEFKLVKNFGADSDSALRYRFTIIHSFSLFIAYFLYFTLLYFTLLYFTLLYFTLLYFTLLYFTLLYFTLLYFTLLYFTLLFFTLLYFTLLYFTLLYFTLLYFHCRIILQGLG